MSTEFSRIQSSNTAIANILRELKRTVKVAELARLMGTSRTACYTYVPEEKGAEEWMSAGEFVNVAAGLAEDYENYDLINLMLPEGARIEIRGAVREADGLDNERREVSEINWRLHADEKNPEAIRELARRCGELQPILEKEAARVDAMQKRNPIRKVG